MITIGVNIDSSIEKVWEAFTNPQHIVKWNFAVAEWHCPQAKNDLRPGGVFSYTMAAKDGSMSFDFSGIYDSVIPHQEIAYTLGDGRKVQVIFNPSAHGVEVVQHFEPESMNPVETQQAGWQAILNNFRDYVAQL